MLEALGAPPGSHLVLDRGIATQEQIQWLAEHGYRYIVVSRERRRRFDAEAATAHRTRTGGTVHLEKVDDPDGGEVRLYCYSEERAEKERGIAERFATRFEQGLKALHDGLSRPRTQKKLDKIWQRIGRLQEQTRGVGQHYEIEVEVEADDSGGRQRVTTTFKRADGRTVHVRKATRTEPKQQAILDALGITSSAGGTQKAFV